ncbi:MAG: hypothetical protein JRE18_04565 [Deltaproteobacteria bacterium]|jgi:hypothetical protein|nr:hypothetical protein [Deltaproteobacteria bacterium]
MALVNIESVQRVLLQKLEKLRPPQGIELLSYKRNRSIAVLLLADNTFLVRERGYREEEQVIGKGSLPKHLKALIKIEFPRSRKVRIYQLEDPHELEKERKQL